MYLKWMNERMEHDMSFHQNGVKELPLLKVVVRAEILPRDFLQTPVNYYL